MLSTTLNRTKVWLQYHPNPKMQKLFVVLKTIRSSDIPTPALWNHFALALLTLTRTITSGASRLLIYTPAFKAKVRKSGKNLNLYGGMPYISGPLSISIGDHCRISGQTTFSGRSASENPELIIGNNVGIGWQTTIAVGCKVIIEDNVRIAGKAFLFGYSGHPLNAEQRALGKPDTENQVGNIHLKKDVWLGSNVSVSSGVTIGKGTIVATGSVVTKDLPDYVLAAGNPARVIRSIQDQQ